MNLQALALSLLIFTLGPFLLGQKSVDALSPTDMAEKQIVELKKGHITIVLPSYIKKLNELHHLSQSDALSAKQRNRFKKRYDRQLEDRKEFNQQLIKAADTAFHFTDVRLIYDYQLRSEPPEENFAQAPPFEEKKLAGKEFRLRVGKTKEVQNFGVKAIILTDEEGEDLKDPFPYYVKLYRDFWNGAILWLNRKKEPSLLMQELDYKLTEYYLGVTQED